MSINRVETNRVHLAWLLAVPITLIAYLALYGILPLIVKKVGISNVKELFLDNLVWLCAPDPLKQARYLALISLVPFLFFVGLFRGDPRRFSFSIRRMERGSLAVQIAFAGFVLFLMYYQYRVIGHGVFTGSSWATAFIFAVLAIFALVSRNGASRLNRVNHLFGNSRAFMMAAFLLVGINLLPSIFTDHNLPRSHGIISAHMDHFFGEFAAVFNGKVPLVDYFPQYENLLAYLGVPFFKAFGLNTLSFTIAAACLSFLGMVSYYFIFLEMSGSHFFAFLLFIPFQAIAFSMAAGKDSFGAFNYYGVWPFRYVLPSLTALYFVKVVKRPSIFRLISLSFLGGIAALNNMDFGVPAWFAALGGVIFSLKERDSLFRRETLDLLGIFSVGAILSVLCFSAFIGLQSGHLPDLAQMFQFRKIFALYGFNMLPIHRYGFYVFLVLTFLFALATGMVLFLKEKQKNSDRILVGLLIYSGIFGCGSIMYYIGRAHDWVLSSIFTSWGFAMMILTWAGMRKFLNTDIKGKERLQYLGSSLLPGLILLFFSFGFCAQFAEMPNPWQEIRRLRLKDDRYLRLWGEMTQFVGEYTVPGENVGLLLTPVPEAGSFRVAHATGVHNTFSYTNAGSLILKEQVSRSFEQMVEKGTKKIFLAGLSFAEIQNELNKWGFSLQDQRKISRDQVIMYWTRSRN